MMVVHDAVQFIMDVSMSNTFVVYCGPMFRVVVSMIRVIWIICLLPTDLEVELVFPISQPIVAHVPGFRFSDGNVVGGETLRSGIVGFHWGWRLGMADEL